MTSEECLLHKQTTKQQVCALTEFVSEKSLDPALPDLAQLDGEDAVRGGLAHHCRGQDVSGQVQQNLPVIEALSLHVVRHQSPDLLRLQDPAASEVFESLVGPVSFDQVTHDDQCLETTRQT